MFHIHLVGHRGSSYSIALISQWIALSLARRDDIRLTFAELPEKPRLATEGLFSPEHATVLEALPNLAPGEIPDVEVRMASHYTDPGPGDHPKLLYVFAEARGPAVLKRLPPTDKFHQSRQIGLLMPSRWVRKAFAEQGIPDWRLRDLGVGIDMETYAPSAAHREQLRQQLGITGLAILNVSGMWGAKGIRELLLATGQLISEGHDLRLLLKGNDSVYASKQMLESMLNGFPPTHAKLLSRHISYIGRQMSMPEMAALYNAADLYASPYWAEGFNMPVLEAISCGVPVVCTAGGSTDDFTNRAVARHIRASETVSGGGIVLQPDTAHLTAELRTLVADNAFRARVKTDGPRHVAASHTWDIKAAELVAIAREWSATAGSR